MIYTLRPYQGVCVDGARESLARVQSCLVASATGSGKTVIFSWIARQVTIRCKRVLVLVHRDTLMKQCSRKFAEYGVEHGIIMAGYTEQLQRLAQVASVQSLVRRIRKHPQRYQFDLVIIDEAHLSMAASCREIVDAVLAQNPNAKLLGVTATPSRLDGKGLGVNHGGLYHELVLGPSNHELIEDGYLVDTEIYWPPQGQIDLSKIKKRGKDFDEEQSAAVMDRPVITGSAVDQYMEVCNGAPAIAWCCNIKHAQNVAAEFNAKGLPAMALHGEHKDTERDNALAKLKSGELKCITFCQLLIEGVDLPEIACLILLRPTMSLVSFLQAIGRELRTVYAPGMPLDAREQRLLAIKQSVKPFAYLLDHAAMIRRHGLPDEEREWTLEGATKRKRKKKDAADSIKIAQCEKCFRVFRPAPLCPSCGHPMPTRERKIEHVEGKLEKLTPEMKAAIQKARKKGIAKAKTREEVFALAKEYGYSEKWAEIKWEHKQAARDKFRSHQEVLWQARIADAEQRR